MLQHRRPINQINWKRLVSKAMFLKSWGLIKINKEQATSTYYWMDNWVALETIFKTEILKLHHKWFEFMLWIDFKTK